LRIFAAKDAIPSNHPITSFLQPHRIHLEPSGLKNKKIAA